MFVARLRSSDFFGFHIHSLILIRNCCTGRVEGWGMFCFKVYLNLHGCESIIYTRFIRAFRCSLDPGFRNILKLELPTLSRLEPRQIVDLLKGGSISPTTSLKNLDLHIWILFCEELEIVLRRQPHLHILGFLSPLQCGTVICSTSSWRKVSIRVSNFNDWKGSMRTRMECDASALTVL